MNIAIIPARSGSKRILNKNIKKFLGYPIIYWSIKQAQKTKIFDQIIVSTDSKKIKKLVESYGCSAPFIRPKKISNDKTGVDEVIKHAILSLKNIKPNFVCCINATAPLISYKDLIAGLKKIKNSRFDFVFSAGIYDYPIQRSFQFRFKKLSMTFPKYYNFNSQDLKVTYHDAGQFYWGTTDSWLRKKKIFSKNSSIIEVPNYKVQDIDTIEDWKYAELKYKILNSVKK